MKCSKCNADNAQDALYCKSCKYPLKEVKLADSQPQQNTSNIPEIKQQIEEPNTLQEPQQFQSSLFFSESLLLIKKYLFFFLFFILAVTFFTRNNFKGVKDISPAVLGQPYQVKAADAAIIKFKKNSYKYELSPLYNYEVNALLVSKMNYRAFSTQKFDKVFPYDLCLIWGSNVSSGLYKNETLKFSQDCRWCYARWDGFVSVNWEEFSNNHLLVNDAGLERKLKSLVVGDQVKIKGKLVNVKARLIGKPGSYDSSEYTWNSGVEKTGLGAGACKVIYVEAIEVLKKANVVSYYLFQASFYGLIILAIWNVVCFFRSK